MTARLTTFLTCSLLWLAFLSSVCQGSVYSDSVIGDTGPVLYWNLDGNTMDLVPVAGGVNDGITTFQATLGSTGPGPLTGYPNMGSTNGALAVDGTNDTVIYDRLLDGFDDTGGAGVTTGAYSVQAWFNSSVGFTDKVHSYVLGRGDFQNLVNYHGTARDSVGVGGSYTPAISNNLFYYDGVSAGAVAGSTVLAPDTWYHTLLVRDSNSVKVYLNGQEEISTTAAWAGGDGDLVTFGGRADYVNVGHLNLNGRVDEVAVWDRAVTAAEAQQLYQYAGTSSYVPVNSYAQAVLAGTPAAYWRLNEITPSNVAADASGNGKDMAYFPSPSRTGSPVDAGPRPDTFTGFESDNNAPTLSSSVNSYTDGYALAPGAGGRPTVVVGEDYSTEFWVRPSSDTGFAVGYLYHRRDFDGSSGFGDGLGMVGDWGGIPGGRGRLFFTVGNDPTLISGPTRLEPGNWYHVAALRNGADVSIYLNGELEMSRTYTAPAPGTFDQGTWVFGGRSDLTFLKWDGNIDEVAIYDGVLDRATIQGHYFAGTGWENALYAQAVLGDSPEAYWRLNEITPYTKAADLTRNGHSFDLHAAQNRMAQAGPRSPEFRGFDANNNAPLLTGGPELPRSNPNWQDGYVGIPTGVLPGENDYSVEMWFRRGEVGSIGAYLMHRNDLDAATNTGDFLGLWPGDQPGEINLFLYNGGWPEEPAGPGLLFPGERDVLEDEWYYVGMVREGDEVSVYLNAELEIQATMPLLPGTKWSDGTWAFGGRTDQPQLDQKFTGNIDEIAIYAGALDQSVFEAHFAAAQVPEPSTWMLFAVGGLALAAWGARRRPS